MKISAKAESALEVVRMLLRNADARAAVTAAHPWTGQTPLHAIAYRGNIR